MSLPNRVIWTWLRQSRAEPPGMASEDQSRRALYQSAMQQFEELMIAAAATGASARPLPLFYALSQASQAIIATRGGESPSAHGLDLTEPGSPILHSLIQPKTGGNFWELARVLGSPGLEGPCALGELLFSLPELSAPLVPIQPHWPRAAFLWHDTSNTAQLMAGRVVYTAVVLDPQPATFEEAHEMLGTYPRTKQLECFLPEERNLLAPTFLPTPFGMGLDVVWELKRIDEIGPEYRWFNRRWLRPAVNHVDPPNPIVTWWAVLFALSMLARYYPTAWIASLNRNNSTEATTLEFVLDEALEAVPPLVLEAISSQPFLLPAPDLR